MEQIDERSAQTGTDGGLDRTISYQFNRENESEIMKSESLMTTSTPSGRQVHYKNITAPSRKRRTSLVSN